MPHELKPLPPDHPLFQLGVSFVFRSDLPDEPEEQHADDVEERDADEHPAS